MRAGVMVVEEGEVSPGWRTIVDCGGGVYAIWRWIAVDGRYLVCAACDCTEGVNVIGLVMICAMYPLLIKEYSQRYIYFSRVYTFVERGGVYSPFTSRV